VIVMMPNNGRATEKLEEGFVPGVVWEAALQLEPTTYGLQNQFLQFSDVQTRPPRLT